MLFIFTQCLTVVKTRVRVLIVLCVSKQIQDGPTMCISTEADTNMQCANDEAIAAAMSQGGFPVAKIGAKKRGGEKKRGQAKTHATAAATTKPLDDPMHVVSIL